MTKYNKLLGTGFSGSTYLIKKNNKKYALKIQHILEKDLLNKKSNIWYEIKFYKYVGNYWPLFKKFYSYKIIKNCEFKKNNKSIGLKVSKNYQKEYERLQKSKYCIEYLTSYEKNDLSSIINKLNKKQFYSLVLQILYAIKILQKRKYTHNDFNIYNITYNTTNKKYIKIKINNKYHKIPVIKYIFTIIDYGNIQHPSFINNKKKYLKNYKIQDINNLINNIEKYWSLECKVIKKEDITFLKNNNNNINKLIKYFTDKISIK